MMFSQPTPTIDYRAWLGEAAVKISCPICRRGQPKVVSHQGAMAHYQPPPPVSERYAGLAVVKCEGERSYFDACGWIICPDWDDEYRHASEPLGFYAFAWWPRLCRNGTRRWMTWVERHDDGTYSLGNRAR